MTRLAGVLAILAAWFVVSNSCGLVLIAGAAGLKDAGQTIRKCCGSHPDTPGKIPAMPGKVCCKALRMLPPDPGVNLIGSPKTLPLFELVWTIEGSIAAGTTNRSDESAGTGPPRARRFAELVLQRSLFVHAPPVLG